jgi:hypothetical protein
VMPVSHGRIWPAFHDKFWNCTSTRKITARETLVGKKSVR